MEDRYKLVWTEQDFEVMGWHDVTIHALAIIPREYNYELILDIDYIFEWIHPAQPESPYSFMVAPATLSFSGVWDVHTKIATGDNLLAPVSITDIQRSSPRSPGSSDLTVWDWKIALLQGSIIFAESGYTQYVRRRPMHSKSLSLEESERGPVSFAKGHTDAAGAGEQ